MKPRSSWPHYSLPALSQAVDHGSSETNPRVSSPAPLRVGWLIFVAAAALFAATCTSVGTNTPEVGTTSGLYPAWSPDGRFIMFLRPRTPDEVWIASADGSHVRRLTSTTGRIGPMMRWSPDGRFVVLEVEPRPGDDREVRIARVSDGSVRTLATNAFAPRWSPDGNRIAFLRRDHAAGRTDLWEVEVTTGSANSVVTSVADHDFLWTHDGDALIYAARRALHMVRRDGSSARTLTPFDAHMGLGRMANIDVSRDGRLAFVRGGMLRTLDLATGETVDIGALRRPRGIAFSPDGQLLAFFERFPDGLIAVVPSTGGQVRPVGRVECLACRIRFDWAPDSRHIAAIRTTVDRSDLYVVPAEGGESRLMVQDVSWGQRLRSFSPDGRHIAYVDGTLGPANNVFIVDVDTQQSRRVTHDTVTSKLYAQWSPDGKWIAYFAGRAPDPQATLELWVVSADGGAQHNLTEGMNAISGDGFDWIATSDALLFVSGDDNELWSVSVPSGELRRLSSTGGWDDPWKGLPTWRPVAGARTVAYLGGARFGVNALSLDDGRRWKVSPIVEYSYSWAPDGNAIAYAVARGISVAALDGSDLRQLTVDGGDNPVWSPNGSFVAYVGRDGEIWSVRPSGGPPRRITSGAVTAGITFSPDGRWIGYNRLVSDPQLWIVDVPAR